jgi:CRP/FNR family transcriptional regulator, cyclic AMP receptor protein
MDDVLVRATLFTGLTAEAAQELAALFHSRTVARGTTVYREGEVTEQMFAVINGRVGITRRRRDGRSHLISVVGPGELMGGVALFDPLPFLTTATALTDLELAVVDIDVMRQWLDNSAGGGRHMLTVLAGRVRHLNELLVDRVMFTYVPSRLARAILELGERFGVETEAGIEVDHGLTQVEFAQYVGASRESVNKALARLAAMGIIRQRLGTIDILELDLLRQMVL